MATVASINTNLTATTGNLEKGVKRGEQVIKGFAARMRGFAFALPNAQRIIAGSVAALGIRAIFGEVKQQLDSLGSLFDQAINLGIEPQKLQALGFAAEQAGSSTEELQSAIAKMVKNTKDMKGLSPEQKLFEVADAMAAMNNPADRIQFAMKTFGRSGAGLISMLSGGSAGLRKAVADFRALGGTLTTLDFAAADAAGDGIGSLNAAFDNMKKNLVVGASPAIIMFSQSLIQLMATTGEAAKSQFALSRAYMATNAAVGDLLQRWGVVFDPKLPRTQEMMRAQMEGPVKASDIIHENFNRILRDIEANQAAARGLNVPGLPGAASNGRKAEAAAVEIGTAKGIEAANKAMGAKSEKDIQKQILRVEKDQVGVMRDIRRALANRPQIVPANLG